MVAVGVGPMPIPAFSERVTARFASGLGFGSVEDVASLSSVDPMGMCWTRINMSVAPSFKL